MSRREKDFFLYEAVFYMGGQGQGRGGEEVKEIDPLGQILGHSGEVGHIDEEQSAASHPEAREDPGGQPGEKGPHQAKKAERIPA